MSSPIPALSILSATDMKSKVPVIKRTQNVEIKNSSATVEVGATKRTWLNCAIGALTSEHLDILGLTADDSNLDIYLKTASMNAILNTGTGGRADEIQYYPGTREEVIGKVERWQDGQIASDSQMLWLSGHAGAGKSAIVQAVAENAAERGVDAANFFFFRTDSTRNGARALVATLVYQLLKLYPTLREYLTDALEGQPLVSTAPVKEQFSQLLASPIEYVRRSSAVNREISLIIDGLDECKDEVEQLQILCALHDLVRKPGSPFRVLVASRVEPHMVMFFNKIADSVHSIFLSDDYRPEGDIRKFVIAKFDDIKRTRQPVYTLSKDWPTPTDIDKIVSKSSGQLAYAATVMRFIEYSKDNPAASLLTVYEIRPPTTHRPFAQLDALYSQVLSKARDIRAAKLAIGFYFWNDPQFGRKMLDIAGYKPSELESLFADISAIAHVSISNNRGVHVQFYHVSLPEYLKNKSRSGIYYVDEREVLADACAIGLSNFHDTKSLNAVLLALPNVKQTTNNLTSSLLDTSQRRMDYNFGYASPFHLALIYIIAQYFETDKVLCGHILHGWIRFGYIHNLDVDIPKGDMGLLAYLYFQNIRLTEKAKFLINRAFTRDGR